MGDSNANPANPLATPVGDWRYDDELYNLLPFVSNGDTSINVFTQNPSNDDNILFAALFLASTTAIVGEGIILAPTSDTNPVNTQHTVTATVQDDSGAPIVGRDVAFEVISGPHMGQGAAVATDSNGQAKFTYTGLFGGTDTIQASFVSSTQETKYFNKVEKTWVPEFVIPEVPYGTVTALFACFAALAVLKTKRINIHL